MSLNRRPLLGQAAFNAPDNHTKIAGFNMPILSVTGSPLAFDQFFIFTNGGPDNSTVSMVMVIYRAAFFRFDLGGAAAMSVVLLLALVGLNVLMMRRLR
ncbi:MAG TPA: hypothetical protein VKZ82_11225 [Nonomuraea sp.]|nr:hypothetical protein [Nonomuraea sp.]